MTGKATYQRKIASAPLEKRARNIARLLSRVGPNLFGATARDLKFLRRRGLRGFGPEQVRALRSRGMLPTVEQELAGFNRGTENMLKWVPRSSAPNPYGIDARQPIVQVIRNNAADTGYQTDIIGRSVTIPDVDAARGLSLPERERLSAIARHEAREWVRGNAAVQAGRPLHLPGHTGTFADLAVKPEVGSSHFPGVIHDERVFRSQLANRLGWDTPWHRMPLTYVDGQTAVRGARDAYVGSMPLRYEFDRIKEWRRLQKQQRSMLPRLIGPSNGRLSDPEVVAAADSIARAAHRKYMTTVPRDWIREYEWNKSLVDRILSERDPARRAELMQNAHNRRAVINNRRLERFVRITPQDLRGYLVDGRVDGLPVFAREAMYPYQDSMSRIGIGRAAAMTGIPRRDIPGILAGTHVYARPGSELAAVQGMDINVTPAQWPEHVY